MALLNPRQTSVSAFAAGFLRGMAAPCALFSVGVAPGVPQIAPVEVPGAQSVAESLANDWGAVGGSFQASVSAYGQVASSQG